MSRQARSQQRVTARVSDVLDFGRKEVRNFVLSDESRRLFVSHLDKDDALLDQWNVDTRQLVHTYRLGAGFICDSVAVSPNGRFAVVACFPLQSGVGRTILLDTVTFATIGDLALYERVREVHFDRDGGRFRVVTNLMGSGSPGVAYDTAGNRILRFDAAEFSRPDSARVWRVESSKTTSGTHGLYCKDAGGKPHRLTDKEWDDNYGVTRDGRYLAATTRDGELIVWRLEDAAEIARLKMAERYGYLQYDSKYDRFLWCGATGDGTTKLKAIALIPQND
jgi:hypothetical protein